MSVHLGACPPPPIPKSWLRYCCQLSLTRRVAKWRWPIPSPPPYSLHEIAATALDKIYRQAMNKKIKKILPEFWPNIAKISYILAEWGGGGGGGTVPHVPTSVSYAYGPLMFSFKTLWTFDNVWQVSGPLGGVGEPWVIPITRPPLHLGNRIYPYLGYWFPLAITKNTPFAGFSREIFPRLRPKIPPGPFPRKWEYTCGSLMHSSEGGGGGGGVPFRKQNTKPGMYIPAYKKTY